MPHLNSTHVEQAIAWHGGNLLAVLACQGGCGRRCAEMPARDVRRAAASIMAADVHVDTELEPLPLPDPDTLDPVLLERALAGGYRAVSRRGSNKRQRPEAVHAVRLLAEAGRTDRQIAEQIGASMASVCKLRGRYGIRPGIPQPAARPGVVLVDGPALAGACE